MQRRGLPGDYLTRNNRFAQLLMQQQGSNNGSTAGGIGEIIRQGLAGYLMGKDSRDQTEAMESYTKGAMTKPWVNPDTGTTSVPQQMAPGTQGPPQMVPTGPAGGVEGALSAMQGLGGNEYAGRFSRELVGQKMARDQQMADLAAQREWQAALLGANQQFTSAQADKKYGRDVELNKAKADQDYQRDLQKMMAQFGMNTNLAAAKPYLERGMPVPPGLMGGQLGQTIGQPPLMSDAPETGGITGQYPQPSPGGPMQVDPRGPVPPPPRTLAEAKAQEAAMIEAAKVRAKSGAEKDTSTALDTFNVGMRNLEQAMGNTTTNPLVGALPALTSEAQTAEGAVSSLAPVLKQMFRQAGEGIFTDRDQALLMQMIPTRSDFPEARDAKIKMINDIVRAKLGTPGQPSGQTQRLRFNPQTGGFDPAGTGQ